MMPSTSPSSLSHWRTNSVRIALTFANVTQFAIGFSWKRITFAPSLNEEKFTIGTLHQNHRSIVRLLELHVAEVLDRLIAERPFGRVLLSMAGIASICGKTLAQHHSGLTVCETGDGSIEAATADLDGMTRPRCRQDHGEIDLLSVRTLVERRHCAIDRAIRGCLTGRIPARGAQSDSGNR